MRRKKAAAGSGSGGFWGLPGGVARECVSAISVKSQAKKVLQAPVVLVEGEGRLGAERNSKVSCLGGAVSWHSGQRDSPVMRMCSTC